MPGRNARGRSRVSPSNERVLISRPARNSMASNSHSSAPTSRSNTLHNSRARRRVNRSNMLSNSHGKHRAKCNMLSSHGRFRTGSLTERRDNELTRNSSGLRNGSAPGKIIAPRTGSRTTATGSSVAGIAGTGFRRRDSMDTLASATVSGLVAFHF